MKTMHLAVAIAAACFNTIAVPLYAAETSSEKLSGQRDLNSLTLLTSPTQPPVRTKTAPIDFRFRHPAGDRFWSERPSAMKFRIGDMPVFSIPKKEPNHAPEPTPATVTPRPK